jgi:adenine-specific DNA-methyltransferase
MPTLDWLNRKSAVTAAAKVPGRIFQAVPDLGCGDPAAENLLIQGDNLDTLKALLPFYAGRVKCIYIDPPYNTGSAFEHYDDNVEHSTWLSLMFPRLVLLRDLLAEDGSIWVSIDDTECHYLKVIMDEVFGRKNFISEIIWQKRTSRENRAAIGSVHDTILLYGKTEAKNWKEYRNLLPSNTAGFSNPDNDSRGPWRSIPFSAQGYRPNQMYDVVTPSGSILTPPRGRCWGATEPEFKRLQSENMIYFPKGGEGRPRVKLFAGNEKGLVPMSLWLAADVGDTEDAKKEVLSLFSSDTPFGTPKPESLIRHIVQISTNPGDLVLDSFLGSGTTAAVALKMGRRFIGIEMGEHAVTHCAPRLRKVVEGEAGGISEAVGWKGGGGFRFYRLGPAIFDEDGAICKAIKFPELAAHVWFSETHTPLAGVAGSPLLGVFNGKAVYLLYNGILGDRRPQGGNVLTSRLLRELPPHDGPKIVYGECSRMPPETRREAGVIFKQIPYDIRGE